MMDVAGLRLLHAFVGCGWLPFVLVQMPPTSWSRKSMSFLWMPRRTNQSGEKSRWRWLRRYKDDRQLIKESFNLKLGSNPTPSNSSCPCSRIIIKLWRMLMRRSSWPIRFMTWWAVCPHPITPDTHEAHSFLVLLHWCSYKPGVKSLTLPWRYLR